MPFHPDVFTEDLKRPPSGSGLTNLPIQSSAATPPLASSLCRRVIYDKMSDATSDGGLDDMLSRYRTNLAVTTGSGWHLGLRREGRTCWWWMGGNKHPRSERLPPSLSLIESGAKRAQDRSILNQMLPFSPLRRSVAWRLTAISISHVSDEPTLLHLRVGISFLGHDGCHSNLCALHWHVPIMLLLHSHIVPTLDSSGRARAHTLACHPL